MSATDAAKALADLTEISSQIRAAVVFEDESGVLGSTLATDEEADRLASAARRLVQAAGTVRRDGSVRLAQLEAATPEGSVFAVSDGGRTIAAVTTSDPTVGLVFYDLKSCLRALAAAQPERRKRAAGRHASASKGDAAA
jgi:predicted regulator of Ras-like GTPase activity (Roadblock/LC7/MglB family)